jgi:hypothetical protein
MSLLRASVSVASFYPVPASGIEVVILEGDRCFSLF